MIDFGELTSPAAHEGPERIGVGMVVRDASGRILLIRRARHDVLPGLWEFPDGGWTAVEDGDAQLDGFTALRPGLGGWVR